MRQPGNGVRFAATRAVLDQIAFARTVLDDIGQQHSHHI